MTQKLNYLLVAILATFIFSSCQMEDVVKEAEIPSDVITKLTDLGFNPDGIEVVEEGYRIERDIIITPEFLANAPVGETVPNLEQYRTTNLVSATGGRNIVIYAKTSGRNSYSAGMIAGLDVAIARYNAENLNITFSRTTTDGNQDITMTRLKKGDERRGILGSAGFPTSAGDPYNEIKMSGILESSYGLNADEIGTIIAHEIGHCIGFRHTDYFNRSISCGGSASNEGSAGVGAIHIAGTPTGATLSDQSFMLSCTDGSDRPFNNDDVTALNAMY